MTAHLHQQRGNKFTGGFSLVEIMVGMVIGLLGIIVMLQMLSVSDKQKRTTSGSDDAQNAGAIALYGLQRDIQQSGYGINPQRLIGCNVLLRTGVTMNAIAPVTINPASIPAAASDANSDIVMVAYGNSNGSEEGDGITSQPTSPTLYSVQTPTSYAIGDRVIAQYAARQATCSLFLDTVANIASPNVTVASGVPNIVSTNTAGGFTPALFNLGPSPKLLVYAVRNSNLAVCDYTLNDCGSAANATINSANESVWVPVAENIVSLKAQYGRDTAATAAMDGIVDVYDQTTPATACNWARVSAIRLALVARGGSGASTTVAPTWDGSATNPINLTAYSNWKNYRYKVFQTIVPIRNMIIQGVVAGC